MPIENSKSVVIVENEKGIGKFSHIPDSALQALYESIATITDVLVDRHRKAAIFSVDDLETLVLQLDQWTRPYTPLAKGLKIVVKTYDEATPSSSQQYEFHDFEHLKSELVSRTDRVSSVAILFDFLYKDEQSQRPRQCELTIDLSGRVERNHFSASPDSSLGISSYLLRNYPTAVLKVKYSDLIVGKGLQALASNWYNSLPLHALPKTSRFRKALVNYESFDQTNLVAISLSFLSIAAGISFATLTESYLNLSKPLTDAYLIPFWAMLSLIFAYIIRVFFAVLLKKFEESVESFSVPLSLMTVGDARRNEAFGKKTVEVEKKVNFWQTTIVVSFIVNLGSSIVAWHLLG